MIRLENYCFRLSGTPILQNINLQAGKGEFIAVCGPNGAGKSTLLRALAGLLPGGQVDATRVAYVEQGASCAWGLRVAEVVALGRIPWRDADQVAVARAMAACGVAGLARRRVDTLSGGQARRVMLARALATDAAVLLLDEPVADLDPRAMHEVMAVLAAQARAGRCVVAVLHAMELAVAYATRMVVVQDGRVRADGTPDAVRAEAAAAFGMALDGSGRLIMQAGER